MDTVNHLKLTIRPNQIQTTLRALLHAIFFHRLLDNLEPDTIEIQDTHVACSSASSVLEKEISGKIQEFQREYVDKGLTSGEIAVVLLQRKPKKGWFAITEELIPWEEHLITLNFPPIRYGDCPPPNALPGALLQLLTFCAAQKANVPPLSGSDGTSSVSHQILVSPPPPSELFSPSPPLHPTRLTSPPPLPSTTTTNATALARDLTMPPNSALSEAKEAREARDTTGRDGREGRRGSSPAAGPGVEKGAFGYGYFEQAKDGLRAVGAKAGAVAGWTGRGAVAKP